MRFLITSQLETPEGTKELQAHEYGLVVAVYGVLDRFVPEPDQDALEEAFRAWLQEKRDLAREHAAKATTTEGKRLFELLEKGKLAELRPQLLAMMKERHDDLAKLSPAGKLHQVKAPVFLLHGTGDTVIPPSEARWADGELEGRPHAVLVSSLLEHVSVDKESQWRDQLALVDFMANLF
jgi:pimeloyl-ACP methyl ester carboxylesterase